MTSSVPSLLVTKQTSVHSAEIPSYGELLRSDCEPEFQAAYRIYKIMDAGGESGKAWRLSSCRQNAWFTRNIDTGEVRVASSACSLRWCPVCSNARRNFITHEIAEWLTTAERPKLLTLTLRHNELELSDQINQLYAGFRELRRRKEFKEAVTGGIWFFQVKRSKNDQLWHPHLHALITGNFLPRKRLSRMWCEVTSGSEVIDIRAIYEPTAVARDVARYATSPGSLVSLPPDDAIDMVDALHGRRICGTWGTGRAVSLRPKRNDEPHKWEPVGNWNTVLMEYETNPDAKAIILSWKTGAPLGKGVTLHNIDETIDRLSGYAWEGVSVESAKEHERPPPCLPFKS